MVMLVFCGSLVLQVMVGRYNGDARVLWIFGFTSNG